MKNILSASSIKSITSQGKKVAKYCDGNGLYLWVFDTGKKVWYYRYSLNNRRKDLYIGLYPVYSLAEAREKAEEYYNKVKKGVDPINEKKKEKIREKTNTFSKLYNDWFDVNMCNVVETYRKSVKSLFARYILPLVGDKSADSITTEEILEAFREIERKGNYPTAHRLSSQVSSIFKYGIMLGVCSRNPADCMYKLLKPVKENHHAAPLTPKLIKDLLTSANNYKECSIQVRAALRILPYVFVRPGELVKAKWEDISLENKSWSFIASKTKTPHIVPLASQVVTILTELRRLTGNRIYVFGVNGDVCHISASSLIIAYRRMGFAQEEVTSHGWRATARTLLDEVLEYPPHIIEQQLAHKVLDPLGRAYNRTRHLEQRKEMMQKWADYLDSLTQ